MRPIVALLTDFGLTDHYVGAVKGAILAACPEATLVDIAHDLPPHDVGAGSYALGAAYRAFPAGAVFLAVVDPGVGSARRAIALTAGGYRFVGPDNGVFSLVLGEHPDAIARAIANQALFRHEVSSTFHARDIFGPVAGHLAAGWAIEDVGPPASDLVRFAEPQPREISDGVWEAEVVQVDRFGNLTTNLSRAMLDQILASIADTDELVVNVESAVLPLVAAYSDVPEGEGCALLGSSGRLEVAIHAGNASRLFGAGRGAPVRVRRVSVRLEGPVL